MAQIGLANGGGDTINSIKAANEFGVDQDDEVAGLLMFITISTALGLKTAQGMYLTDGWYWDLYAGTRAWSSASPRSSSACRPCCRPATTRRRCTI